MPLLFSRTSSRGVMLRRVASLWFLSHHGICLDYRLILICWIMALKAHVWLFYFSVFVCVCTCVCTYTHMHACTHACTWELHICVCARACLYTCLHTGVTYTRVYVFVSALDTAHQAQHTLCFETCFSLVWNPPTRLTGWPVSTGNPTTTILGLLYVCFTGQAHVLCLHSNYFSDWSTFDFYRWDLLSGFAQKSQCLVN